MPLIKARPSRSDASPQEVDFGNRLQPQPRPQPNFIDGFASLVPRHGNDHAHFRDIEIWPTTDEILAVNAPVFMPKKDDGAPNPISPGPERLLDLLFRHYRFESTERIKDICYSAAQTAFLAGPPGSRHHRSEVQQSSIASSHINHDSNTMVRRETSVGHRYFLYNNVRVEELEAHEYHTILLRLSFDCPSFMRSKLIHQSGRFEEGMLIAVLLLNRTNNELSIQFLQIHRAQSTMSMDPRGGKGRKAAVQAILLPGAATEDAFLFARLAQNLEPNTEICMVEFPKLLPTAIYSPLKRMQQMHGFAFDDYLAPRRTLDNILLARASNANSTSATYFQCPAPAYARGHDFTYDLSPVLTNVTTQTKTAFTVRELDQQSTLDTLRTSSILDDGQAVAFQHCLTNEFAFTQGPPGTGKTYLGIQLTKVLLKSRPHQKPIVVVCLTNHALDSFLAGLRDAGITNLLRIGNGSKEEWTQAFSLRQRTRKMRLTAEEYQMKRKLQTERNGVFASIHDWCRGASSQTLTGTLGWYAVDRLLASTNPNLHRQLKLTDNPASQKFLFEHWADGGDLQALRQLRNRLASNHSNNISSNAGDGPTADQVVASIYKAAEAADDEAGSQNIWQMTTQERRALLDQWKNEIDPEQLANELAESFADYQATKDSLGTLRELVDLRAMDQAFVVGITTTGCATRSETLRALGVEVVICEEAGEVMEPHALLALLPTVQHAIFIGDPLQLRPEVSEQRLVLERSSDYRLNESLFERMIMPRDPSAEPLAFAQLTIQRRMHPAIAEIPRIIYPALLDHDSTRSHKPTVGIEERMFWWDHRAPELEETSTNKSHVNEHEVGMVTGLVEYLLKGSAYSQGDIAVLTAYSGQLVELHKALSRTCKIWLSDKDRTLLLENEALDLVPTELRKKDEVRVSDMLRLTTVDNFQGEEAAIVIISTVRSGNRPGFLASENRINVACSRARNGFYIIGNSKTLSAVPMWRSVLQVFGTRRGPSLMTYCSNHPQHRFPVTEPNDFASIMDCPITCGKALPCGHTCAEKCHPMKLHADEIMPCTQPCEKTLSCGHQCKRPCGVDCGTCLISVDEVTLPCGHKGSILCSGDIPDCGVQLDEVTLDCGHRGQRVCGDDPIEDHACAEPCSQVLDCGHNCTGTCSECRRRGHPSCSGSCDRSLPCGHDCLAHCGHDDDCPACKQMTRIACEHETRIHGCQDLPWICFEPQSVPCEHVTDSKTPCFLPRASLPCPELCTKLLACGHQCPSLHGEACIPETYCPACLEQPTFTTLVYVEECGHVVSVKELDQLNLQGVYELDEAGSIVGYGTPAIENVHMPKCVCGSPCPSLLRYQVIGKMVEIDDVLERMFGYVTGERFCKHAKRAVLAERELALSYENWKIGIRPDAVASAMNSRRIQDRHNDLLELKGKLVDQIDRFIAPVEKAMKELHGCMPSAFPYTMTVQLRYSILGLRLSAAMVLDSLRMARHLSSLTDPTLMIQRMSEILLRTTTHGAEASRLFCKELLENDACEDAPALYCELHLRQIHLWLLVDYSLGKMSDNSLIAEGFNDTLDHEVEQIPEMLDILDLVVEISNLFPTSCGSFSVTALHFKQLLQLVTEDEWVATIPTLDITTARRVEDRFGRYNGAKAFTVCEQGHGFFEDVFGENGCPECDSKVVVDTKAEYDHGKHLFEDQFLVAMEAITSKTSSPAKSLNRKQGQQVANGLKSVMSSSASSAQLSSTATPVMPQTSTESSSDSGTEDADGEATPRKKAAAIAAATPVKKGPTNEEKFLEYMAEQGWKFGRESDEPKEPEKGLTNEEKFLKYMADQGWKFGQEFDENDGCSPLKKDADEPEEPEKVMTNEERFIEEMNRGR